MAWLYRTFTIAAKTAAVGAGAAFVDDLLDGIVALSGAGWTKTTAGTVYQTRSGWGAITHTPSNARLAVTHKADGGTNNYLQGVQNYAGTTVTSSALLGPHFAYSWPAGSAATLPSDPWASDSRAGSALYSQISSNGTFTTTTQNRWHVWAEDTTGALIIAVQQNTASATIEGVGLFGDFVPTPLNPGDTGAPARQIQWVGANTTLADAVTGQGQCLDGTGTRVLAFAPIGSVGLTTSGGTAIYQAPVTYASAATVVANNSVIKGRIDSASVRIGREGSAGQTTDTQTHVYLRGKIWVRWTPSWGTFIV
jgi:hypothetical protein